MKTFKYIMLATATLLLVSSCKDDNSFGKNTDIIFPIPVINTVTANPMVGDTITLTGVDFTTPNTVSIDGIPMTVLSEDSVHIVTVLPRIFHAAPIIVKNAFERTSQNVDNIDPIYPTPDQITVTAWPTVITRGRMIAINGTNLDMVTSVTIGSTKIQVDGLTQDPRRLLVLVPTTVSETSSKIVLTTIDNSTIVSPTEIPIQDYDPNNWTPIDPLLLTGFEDGVTHYLTGEVPATQCSAQINRAGVAAAAGNSYFSLYANNLTGSYSMWSYLGSVKLNFAHPIKLAQFHDPYISFLWNSDDNIGSFQMAATQGTKVGGGTFSPGKTNSTIDPNAVNDQWTLRPTNGQWQWVTTRLSDFVVESWGGGFTQFDPAGDLNSIELVFKQINGVYWTGAYTGPNVYDQSVQSNHNFKANIDQIMITDGPYLGHY